MTCVQRWTKSAACQPAGDGRISQFASVVLTLLMMPCTKAREAVPVTTRADDSAKDCVRSKEVWRELLAYSTNDHQVNSPALLLPVDGVAVRL